MITICVGLWDNRSSLSFCSTSGGLPKLAQLQLGEGGEAGTERPNFLRAKFFFFEDILLFNSLSLSLPVSVTPIYSGCTRSNLLIHSCSPLAPSICLFLATSPESPRSALQSG